MRLSYAGDLRAVPTRDGSILKWPIVAIGGVMLRRATRKRYPTIDNVLAPEHDDEDPYSEIGGES